MMGIKKFQYGIDWWANLNDKFNAADTSFIYGIVTIEIAGVSAAYTNSIKNGVNDFNEKTRLPIK